MKKLRKHIKHLPRNGILTEINEAYNVLSNEKKREEYDNEMLFGFSFGFKSFYPEEVNPFKKTSMDLNAEDDEKLSKMFAKLRKEKA